MTVRRGRQVYLAIHKYVGLGLGLWIALVGLTGSILVYQRELEALQRPHLYTVPPGENRADFETLTAAVTAAYPGRRIAAFERDLIADNEAYKFFLMPADAPGAQTVIVAARDLTVFVDPFRATILGEQHGRSWLDATRDLHIDLLLGRPGRAIVVAFGLALLVSIIAGVVLWWPSRNRFAKAFTLRWTQNTRLPRKMWDLHHVTGIYALVVLVVVTATGAILLYQSPVQRFVSHVVDISPTKVDPQDFPDLGPVSLNQAVGVVHTLYPNATIRRVSPPNPARATYLFQIVPANRSNMYTSNVTVKADTGQVAYIFDPERQAPARSFIGLWSVFIHNGAAIGDIGRWLVLASGLVYTLLLGTGIYIWAKKV
jgi:uncharacterized iron-regulated membrane protein